MNVLVEEITEAFLKLYGRYPVWPSEWDRGFAVNWLTALRAELDRKYS